MATAPKDGLALLRDPFKANQISKLPKPYRKDSPKGKCPECGGYHGLPAMHLDYVGHAALTDRLLDADPTWTWEPVADPRSIGLPVDDSGMWIRLTVCGVTRLGFGCASGKSGGDAVKEVIGDALRNAAMRFGAALDLWHKGNLHEDDGDAEPILPAPPPIVNLPAGTVQILSASIGDWGGADIVVVDANGEQATYKTTERQLATLCEQIQQEAIPVTLQFDVIKAGKNKGKDKLVGVTRYGVVKDENKVLDAQIAASEGIL